MMHIITDATPQLNPEDIVKLQLAQQHNSNKLTTITTTATANITSSRMMPNNTNNILPDNNNSSISSRIPLPSEGRGSSSATTIMTYKTTIGGQVIAIPTVINTNSDNKEKTTDSEGRGSGLLSAESQQRHHHQNKKKGIVEKILQDLHDKHCQLFDDFCTLLPPPIRRNLIKIPVFMLGGPPPPSSSSTDPAVITNPTTSSPTTSTSK